MNEKQIIAAKAALDSGEYRLIPNGKGRQAALAKFLSPGAPGERLARAGWSEEAFSLSLAEYAARIITSGYDAAAVAGAFAMLGATNSSAASQAAKLLTFDTDELDISPTLGDVWQQCLGASRPLPTALPGLP